MCPREEAQAPDSEVPAADQTLDTQPKQTFIRQLKHNTAEPPKLESLPLFRAFSAHDLEELLRSGRREFFEGGRYLFRRGDYGHTMFVVVQGSIEILLEREREDEAPILLETCETGDFLGEMAFFDGKRRSASALALTDSEVWVLDRRQLTPDSMQRLAASISEELAQRLRRADRTLARLTERTARAAHSDATMAVSAELESIKLLHQDTRQVAEEALAEAEKTVGSVRGYVTDIWRQVKLFGGIFLAALTLLLAWVGMDTIPGFKAKLNMVETSASAVKEDREESQKLLDDARRELAELQSIHRRAAALVETAGELHMLRESVNLDREIKAPETLRRAALNLADARETLSQRYLRASRYDEFDSQVVFDAVDTYVALVLSNEPPDSDHLILNDRERSDLLNALAHTLGHLPDLPSTQRRTHSELLFDRRVRDMLGYLAADAEPSQLTQLVQNLMSRLRSTSSDRARWNLALSVADLYQARQVRKDGERRADPSPYKDVIAKLEHMRAGYELAHDLGRVAAAHVALAQLGERGAVADLSAMLEESRVPEYSGGAYPAALLLAELGPTQLEQLIAPLAGHTVAEQTRAHVVWVLHDKSERADGLEARYARYLLSCFGASGCSKDP